MTILKAEPKETSPLSGRPQRIHRLFRQLIPEGFCYEAKKLIGLAVPMLLAMLMIMLFVIVSTMFCGHLGKIELDAVILAEVISNISGLSIGIGLTTACDTLMSQTYGSKNMKRVGVILQRGILIMMLCCFPCWAIFLNTEKLLLLFRQDPTIARLTQEYVLILLPGLPAIFLQLLQMKYLESQSIIWPQVIVGLVVNIINAALNAVLIYVLKMGVEGSAWANTLSQWIMVILLFVYIVGRKLHVETWGGWSTDCLQEWGLFMKLAIPSLLMICVEWWSLEIGTFLAGIINPEQLGGQAVTLQLLTVAVLIADSFGTAANVRIGNALGAGNAEQAKKSSKVVLCLTVLASLVYIIVIGSSRHVIGYVFTSDKGVVDLVSRIMLIYITFHLFDGMAVASGGILMGIGRQKIGAITNIVGFYVLGLPVGITLMFVAKLGVIGLWIGMLLPGILQVCIYIPYIFLFLDWNVLCNEAKIRAGLNPQAVPDPKISDSKGELNMGEKGDTSVSEPIHEGAVILPDLSSAEDDTTRLEKKEDLPVDGTNVVGEILTTKQLIVRRGLTVFLAVGILFAGIIVRLLTAKS